MEGHVHPDFAAVAERLRKVIHGGLFTRGRGGAAIAVYHHGELVVDAWGGVKDTAGTPWDRDTMATSFSTTKGVVATVVHRLADRGELAYDDPVAEHWPEFAAAGKERITIRDLLTHQAALHDVRGLVDSPETLHRLVDGQPGHPSDHLTEQPAVGEPVVARPPPRLPRR